MLGGVGRAFLTAAVGGSIRIDARNCRVMLSSREARFTTGPNTVTFTWSTVPIFPATARPLAMPMPTRKSAIVVANAA